MFPLTLVYQIELLPPVDTPVSVQNPKQQVNLKYNLVLDSAPTLPLSIEFKSYKTIMVFSPLKFNTTTRIYTCHCGFKVLNKEDADKFIQAKLADGWIVD